MFWRWLTVVLAAMPAAPMRADDHGDGPEWATLLAIGDTVAGEVGTADADVFRLDLHGVGGFEFHTTGQTDTTGELVTGSGVVVAMDEDSGPGTNFRIEAELSAGVYYLTVSGDRGSYAVNARVAGRPDHGDTAATSSLLPVRTAAELAAAEPSIVLGTSGRIHPTTADVDVFRIDVDRESAVAVRSSPKDLDLDGVLAGPDGTTVAADDAEGGLRIGRRLPAGTYYLEVTGETVGAYRILAHVGDYGTDTAAWGIAYARGRLLVVVGDRVLGYGLDGSRASGADLALTDTPALPFSPRGTVHARGVLYIAEWWNDRVHVFDQTGGRVPGREFDLAVADASFAGMTYDDGLFHVVDAYGLTAYAYATSGTRVPHRDFVLASGNEAPSGIARLDGAFYVADREDARVYAYDPEGSPLPDLGFALAPDNTRPRGVAVAERRFHVVDGAGRVYVYEAGAGRHVPEAGFVVGGADAAETGGH